MSWFIKADVNDGFPWQNEFPTSFKTKWTWDDSIVPPAPMWWIDSANDGFPSNRYVPPKEFKTGWTSIFNGVQIPHIAWRITPDTNDGFPYIWYWFQKEVETDPGTVETEHDDMDIGGSQTNYDPFTRPNFDKLREDLNADDMDDEIFNEGTVSISVSLANAFLEKMSLMTLRELYTSIAMLNQVDLIETAQIQIIQSLFGANIYDGIIKCMLFPFDLGKAAGTIDPITIYPKIFGIWPICPGDSPVSRCGQTSILYDMGTCPIQVSQAWELENVDWSIYLPFAGIYPLDIRSSTSLKLKLGVDLFTGAGEYSLYENGQIMGLYRCQLGIDFPINTVKGQMQTNVMAFANQAVGSVLSSMSTPTGAVSAVGNLMQSKGMTQHNQIMAPSIGAGGGSFVYPKPRLIAKIPKMQLDAYGYDEIFGANRSYAVDRVSECSGYTVCMNYKSNIISATSEEKEMIESLMNEGVFI